MKSPNEISSDESYSKGTNQNELLSFVDETNKTTFKIAKRSLKMKTQRLRKCLLNEKLLDNYFVFDSKKQIQSTRQYKVLSQRHSIATITSIPTISSKREEIVNNQNHQNVLFNNKVSILEQLHNSTVKHNNQTQNYSYIQPTLIAFPPFSQNQVISNEQNFLSNNCQQQPTTALIVCNPEQQQLALYCYWLYMMQCQQQATLQYGFSN